MADKLDYYNVLGVDKNANPDQIKQAYKKLAKEHHPDMVRAEDKEKAEKRFKEINEAYQVLSDPQKKNMYDQFGHAGVGPGAGGGQGPFGNAGQWGPFSYSYSTGSGGGNPFSAGGNGGFDPFDVFEDFFGFRGFGGQRAPRRGKNLYYEITVEFSDSVFGLEKDVKTEAGNLKIKIPAGIRDGTEIRYPGKGMVGPNNAPAGDLYLTVRVKRPSEFEIAGENIVVAIRIDFIQAILGSEVEVPVVDLASKSGIGKAKLVIPAGTQPGTRFAIRGKGMPRLQARGHGDVLVQVFVDIPKKLSRKQREVLESYKTV